MQKKRHIGNDIVVVVFQVCCIYIDDMQGALSSSILLESRKQGKALHLKQHVVLSILEIDAN